MLERPNEWDRQLRAKQEAATLTGLSKIRHDFWAFYRQHYDSPPVRPGWRANNVYFNIGDVTISLYVVVKGVGVYLRDRNSNFTAEQSPLVHRCRDILEDPGVKEWQMESANPDNWPAMASWLHDRFVEYRDVVQSESADIDSEALEVETC